MRVQFTEVGHDKRSWTARMQAPITEAKLVKQIKARGGIVSGAIDFEFDGAANTGVIYVGGFHSAGVFRIIVD